MIACQIKIDDEWLTGCYLENPTLVRRIKDDWHEKLGIQDFRAVNAWSEGPKWQLQKHRNGQWRPSFKLYHADLRALLLLIERITKQQGIDPADWRIRPYVETLGH